MSSLRARVLVAVLGLLAVAALLVGGVTYRNVRAETEALFDYQLRQMALSLRDQGEVAPAQASALAAEQLDFGVQVWSADGRAIYASRRHAALPLRALMADGGLNAKEVGRAVGLSQPAAWRRIRRLEEAGVIRGRRIVLDREKLGSGVSVFLGVRLAGKGRLDLEAFERAVQAIPEVQLVQHVLGIYDYRLRVVARDLSDFERILRRRIMTLPGVGAVESNVILSDEKVSGALI